MSIISIKIDTTNITAKIQKQTTALNKLPADGLVEYRALTPIKSGNARRNTNLMGNSIQGNYNYASRLDSGSSKQAPAGMTRPFTKWWNNQVKKIARMK